MTVRDKAPSQDKATEWPAFQKFRRLAEEAMSRSKLDTTSAQMQINDLFRAGIVNAYFERVTIPGASEGRSQAESARKIGIDPTTYLRWLRRETTPGADKFVLLAAAADSKLPRGGRAALQGFCAAFAEVQARLGKPDVRLSGRQALCLWAAFRTQAWWDAAQASEPQRLTIASREVRVRMNEYRPKKEKKIRIVSAARIQATIKDRWLAWTILELVLKHEWL